MLNYRIFLRTVIPVLALIYIVIFAGCEITNPTKDLKVIVSTIERENMVSVTLNDVIGGGVVTSNVNVEIIGRDAGKVIDEVNNKKTTFTVKNGFLSFAIENGTNISAASPIKFTLKITSDSYLDVEYPVTLTANGRQLLYVNMVKKENTSQAGIEQETFENAGTTDNSGNVTQDVNVTTDKGSVVTIPQGTNLKDENGNVLTGGINISTTVYYPESAEYIPEGIQENGNNSFVPLMSISVTITDGSGKVANGVNGNIFIPSNNDIDPETGLPFQTGDKLQMGYVDPQTGQLVLTGEMEYMGSNAGLKKTMTRSSSGWLANLLALTNSLGLNVEAWKLRVLITGSISLGSSFNTWDFSKVPLELVVDYFNVYRFSGNIIDTWNVNNKSFSLTNFTFSRFSNAYLRMPGNDNIRFSADHKLVEGTNTLELTAPPVEQRAYDVTIKGRCPSDRTKEIIPGGTVITVYNEAGTQILSTVTLNSSGQAGLYLQKAGVYKVRSTYNGKDYEADISVDDNGIPTIGGENIETIRVDASASPIVLQYYILTKDACD